MVRHIPDDEVMNFLVDQSLAIGRPTGESVVGTIGIKREIARSIRFHQRHLAVWMTGRSKVSSHRERDPSAIG